MKRLIISGLQRLSGRLGYALHINPMCAVVFALSFALSTSLFANPVLDNVAAGNVTINQTPNSTVVNQTSPKAIINWQSFNIGNNQSTHFQQPAGGIALNRINPSQGVSQIYGRLTATGQIILVNPAGIFFAPGSYVNVGSLIASTANISDQDFLNGYYHFANVPGYSGSIINQGQIIAADHGLVALIGGAVTNDGYIQANLGHAVLASGDSFSMTFAGNDLVSFSVDHGASQSGGGVTNTGSIYANGGQILVTAKAAAGVLDNVINMNGVAQARSIEDAGIKNDGEIILWGDGLAIVGAEMDASSFGFTDGGKIIIKTHALSLANGASFNVSSALGDGGFIETSGTHELGIGDITINVASAHGKGGTWLIDPADINITTVDANITGSSPFIPTATAATLNVATLTAALASGDVIVRTTNDGFAGNGDITVSSAITWSSSYTLLLEAFNNIIINAPISGINGTLQLSAINAPASITTGASGSVDVNNFNLLQGQWYQNTGALPGFTVRNNFQITGSYTPTTSTSQFIRATSGNGAGTPYVLVDVYGLQGIGSNATTITQNFNLGNNIDASSTIRWNNGAGFVPIGLTSNYIGTFNGLNNSISNLYINLPTTNNVGLFSSTNLFPVGAVMSNLAVINANVTGSSFVGILTGFSANLISNVFVSGNVNSFTDNATEIGGMVGRLNQPFNEGVIANSGSNVNVNVYGNNVSNIGGLAGNVYASHIQDSYSIGNITLTQSGGNIGGIAGQIYLRTFQNNYAGGNISILGTGTRVGGAFGLSNGTTLNNNYSTTNISVGSNSYGVGGLIGHWFTGLSINQSYSSGSVTAGSGSTGVAGFAGLYDSMTINNSYWDIGSSGQSAGFGISTGYAPSFSITNFNGGCFGNTSCNTTAITNASNAGGSPVDLSLSASYTGFTFDATTIRTGNTSPGSNWVMIEGATRPMLSSEWNLDIRTPHQIQLMSFATGGDYQLHSNVEFQPAMNSLSEVWATNVGANLGNGFMPVGTSNTDSILTGLEFTGTFNGNNFAINNLYIHRPTYDTVGLFGATGDNVTIQNLSLSHVNFTGRSLVGGLTGQMIGGGAALISNINITGSVTTTGNTGNSFGIGGLTGQIGRSGTTIVQNTYSTANINASGSSTIGGLVGYTEGLSGGSVTFSNNYATGSITNTPDVIGGFIGWISTNTTVNNSFWDIGTTGRTNGFGLSSGTVNNLYGGCFGNTSCNGSAITNATNAGGSPINLALDATYSDLGWSITSTPSSTATAPANTWFIFEGLTRPMLMTENSSSVSNSHQVQMMGAALGKNYSLFNNVYTASDMDNLAEVWGSKSSTASGTGFVPIANFSAVLNGNRFAIDGLYINGYTHHGLFASTTNTAYIMNLGITGGSVTGGSYVAGIVGLNAGHILNSYNTSTLNASGSYLNYMGGIAGYNTGVITNSYNSGSIGTLADGGAFGTVGGIAGYNSGQISTSYNTGTLNGLTQFNGNFGGVVGTNDTTGTITDTFNSGVVSAFISINATGFGGLVGNNLGTITNSLSYGYVAIPGGSNFTAGFAGINTGTITGSFWNSDTSGRASGVASGSSSGITGGCFTGTCTNGGTANLASNVSPTTYTTAGWDMTNVWNIIEDKSYPYLRAFYAQTPRVIAGSSPAAGGNTVNLAVSGTVVDTITAGANGEFYFFAGYNTISSVNRAIADSTPALVYLTSGASLSNAVILTPASTGNLSGTTSLTLTANTVTAGNNSASGDLSNSLLSTAKGSLSSSNILYAVDGSNNLTLNANRSFQTTATTAYTINGNVAATSANTTFNGGVTIGSANPTISTTTSGNITFGSTVTGGGNSFTVSNPNSTTATFSGVISGSGTALTKLGAGALTLSSTSNSFTGGVFLNGGTLAVSALPNAAGNSTIGTGNLSIDNAATLSYTGATGTFNRLITIGAGGATIQSTNASANTLTLSGGVTANGDVTFDTTGAGPTNITLTTNAITGAGNIIKTGSGTLTFAADNSYNGSTTISAGTLSIGNGSTAGTIGSGALINNGAVIFNRSDNIPYSGIISGTGTLTKQGAGILTLSGANTYSGKTTISAGTLSINSLSDINGGASALGAPTTVGNGTIDIDATGVLQYTGSGHSSDRVINLTGSGGTVDASGSGTLTLTGGVTGTNTNLVFTGSGIGIQNGAITTGSGTLTKNGTGTWTLGNAANSYSGGTTINNGVVSFSTEINTGAGVNSPLGQNNNVTVNGGTLSYSGTSGAFSRNFTAGASGGTFQILNAGTVSLLFGSAIITNGAMVFDLAGANTTAVIANIGISGSGSFAKSGSGTINMYTTNSFTGGTILNAGTMNIDSGAPNPFGSLATQTFTYNGGTLITNSGTNTLANNFVLNAAMNIAANASNTVLNGTLSGAGGVNMTGSGTLTLGNAANTYTGATSITGGVLSVGTLANGGVNSSLGATAATTPIALSGGGTLRYTGAAGVSTNRQFATSGTGGVIETTNTSTTAGTTFSGAVDNAGSSLTYLTNSRGNFVTTTGGIIVSGLISGAGNLNLTSAAGAGFRAIELSNTANTYTGQTVITSGTGTTLYAYIASIANGGVASSLGATVASTPIALNSAYLYYKGGVATSDRQFATSGAFTSIQNGGSGLLTLNGDMALNSTNHGFNSLSSSLTLSGVLSGTANITWSTGDGSLSQNTITISNTANTYTGTNTFDVGGTISIASLANAGLASSLGAGTGDLMYVSGDGGSKILTYVGGTTTTNRGMTLENYAVNSFTFQNATPAATVTFAGTMDAGYISYFFDTIGNINITGQVIGALGGVFKIGAGTLTMSNNNNSYAGSTGVLDGILNFSSIANVSGGNSALGAPTSVGEGTITVGATGTLQYTGSGHSSNRALSISSGATIDASGSGDLTISGNISNAATNLNLTGTGTGTLSGILGTTTGSVTKSGAGTWSLNNTASSYSGGTIINAGTLSQSSLPSAAGNSSIGTGNLTINGGALSYTGATGTFNRAITIGASGGTIQTTNASANTLTFSGGITNNGVLTFDTTGAGPTNITQATNIISGTGSIVKMGAGTLTLVGSNSYTGSTTINGGILSANSITNGGSNSALGATVASTPITISGGTLLLTSGTSTSDRQFATSGSGGTIRKLTAGTLTLSGNIDNSGTSLTLEHSDTATYSGVMSGTGNFIKSGVGQLTISSTANSYTGSTTINDGTVWISNLANAGSNSSLGAGLASTPIIIDNNGYLRTGGSITTNRDFVIGSNGGSFNAQTTGGTLSGAMTTNGSFTIRTDANITISGTISGSGSLIKLGAFGLTLSGLNSYSGSTAINGGILFANSIGDAGTDTALGNSSAGISLSAGQLTYTGGTASSARPFTLNGSGSTSDIINNGTGTLTLSGDINHTSNGTLRLQGSANMELSGVLSGNMDILKIGGNTVTLSNIANTYTGANTIGFGVIIAAHLADGGVASSLGNGSSAIVLSHGHLIYSGGTTSTNRAFSITDPIDNSISTSAAGTLTLAGNITFGGTSYPLTLNASAGNIAVTGIISGAGNLIKSGGSTLTLNDNNSYTGTTTVNSGILSIATIGNSGTNTAIGNSSGTITLGGGTLEYTGTGHTTSRPIFLNNATATIEASGSGALTLTGGVTVLGSRSLILSGTGNASQSGAMALSLGTLTKNGTGTWTLSGASSYTGGTIINSGVLSINSIGSSGTNTALGNTSSAISLGAATLQYTGTGHSSSRPITLTTSGGIIDASGSGTLTLSGAVTGNTFSLELTGSGAGVQSGAISTTTGTVTKNGTGAWTMSGASTFTGDTTLNAGTLSIGASSVGSPTITSSPVGRGTLTLNAGTLQSSGTFTILNPYTVAGTVTLGGSNNLTLSGAGTLSSGSLSAANTGGTITLSGNLSGAIPLSKSGAGTLSLSGTNNSSFTGPTTLNAGTLSISPTTTNALGTGALATLSLNGGTLQGISGGNNTLNNDYTINGTVGLRQDFSYLVMNGLGNLNSGAVAVTGNVNFTGNLSGSAPISMGVNSIAVFAGSNNSSYSGTISNSGANGTIIIAAATNALGTGDIVLNASGILQNSVAATITNNIIVSTNASAGFYGQGGGTGGVTFSGPGTFTLNSGSNLGFNCMDGFTCNINSNMYGSGTLTHANGGTLGIGGNNINYSGTIDLSGGPNTLVINSSTTPLGTGTLAVTSGTLTSTVPVTLVNPITINSTGFAFSSDNDMTFNGDVSFASPTYALNVSGTGTMTFNGILTPATSGGSVAKSGTGTLVLNNAGNTYANGTSISGGTLVIGSSSAGGLTSGPLGIGTLALNGGNIQTSGNYTIGNAFTMGGSTTINGTNNLTFSNNGALNTGTLTITNSATTALSGILSGASGITFNSVSGTFILNNTNTYTGKTTVTAGTLNINSIANLSSASALGAPTTIANGTIDLGALGVLQYTGSSNSSSNRVINLTASGGTVDASGSGSLTFSGGITNSITNANLVLTGTGSGTQSGVINLGSGTLTKNGTGTWTLSNVANTYTGQTSITNGVLAVSKMAVGGSSSSLGTTAAGTAILLGSAGTSGTLSYTGSSDTSNRIFTIGAGGGGFEVTNSAATLTLSGALSGSGGLTKTGTGTLTLATTNSYTGTTAISNGILQLNSYSALGSGASQSGLITIASGAKLALNVSANGTLANTSTIQVTGAGNDGLGAIGNNVGFIPTLDNPIVLMGNTTIGGFFREFYLNGNITENSVGLTLTKNGSSFVHLGGNNSFTGATQINGGALVISSANALGTGATQSNGITVATGASIYFESPTVFGNTSILTLNGSGVAPTIGSLTYAVGSGGTVTLNNPIVLASNVDVGVANGGGSDYLILNGVISGGFSLTKNSLIALTLAGNNTYSGGTTINGNAFGRIEVTHPSALGTGAININNGGILRINLNNTALLNTNTINISSSGTILESGSGTVTMNNPIAIAAGSSLSINAGTTGSNLVVAGNITSTSGALSVNSYTSLGAINGDVTISGIIASGTGSLAKFGANTTLTLANNNTYTGTTTIAAGTLQIGNGGATGAVTSNIVNNSALIFDRTGSHTHTNTISGTGSVTKAGTSILTLDGNNSFDGALNINAGTLLIANANAMGSTLGGAILGSGATLTISSVMVGNEGLTINGGTFGGSGVAAFGGAITLNADADISNNGGSFTLGGALNGANDLTLSGAGSTILNGAVSTSSVTATSNVTVGGGTITTLGDQSYQNVATSNDAVFTSSGTGARNITFNGAISGGNNVTLNGSAAGTYTFTVGDIAANNVSVTAAGASSNNVLNLNTAGTQNFTFTSGNTGNVSGIATVSGNFDFSNIHNINGGSGTDTFALSGGTISGSINGGAGTNHLTGGNTVNTWSITGVNGGSVTGIGGTFSNIQNLTGGTSADAFTLAGGSVDSINAGAGNDTLTAANTVNTWTITSSNGGAVTGLSAFSNVENLTGGSSADTFTLAGGTIGGSVNGGAGDNTLVANNSANNWGITANNTGTVTGIGGTFANINNLSGGTGLDIFDFTAGSAISGFIDGGDITNLNQINFNSFNTSWVLRLMLGMPVGGVIDAGLVYDGSNNLIANFARVQMSNGNNVGYITLPNEPSIRVTYYDSTRLNGEIADPFYFFGWIIGNPPIIINNTPSGSPAPPIAAINNQPVFTMDNEKNFDEYYLTDTKIYSLDDGEYLNLTEISPLFSTTSVQTSGMCYAPSNY